MKLGHASWLAWPELARLFAGLEKEKIEARFVGGCVRDSLLGRNAPDVDLATPVTAGEIMARLSAQGIKVLPTGIAHGTVTAVIGNRPFEITTLRRDMACDGRHAEVAFTDNWQEDAARRDFTVNALYADTAGHVFDYFDGLADLQAKRLRFIGAAAERIEEDSLRILRFFRFQAQLGFAGDAAGHSACAAHASRLERLSGERIQQEMLKLIMAESFTDNTLTAMGEAGLWSYLFGEVEVGMVAPVQRVEQRLHLPPQRDVRLAFMLQGNTDALAFICKRWKLSAAWQKQLRLLLTYAPQLTPENQKEMLRQHGVEQFSKLVLLAWANAPERYDWAKVYCLPERWQAPIFPINGDDLLGRGLVPGPQFGKALKRLEALWVEAEYRLSKEELLARLA